MESFVEDTRPEGEATAVEPPSFEEVNSAMFVAPIEETKPDWEFNEPSEDIRQLIQEALYERGLYIGKRKGQWGNLTIFAIQEVVSPLDRSGWRQKIKPGVPDRELCNLVVKFAIERGGYTPVDERTVSILTQEVWVDFLNGLGDEE